MWVMEKLPLQPVDHRSIPCDFDGGTSIKYAKREGSGGDKPRRSGRIFECHVPN